MSSNRNQDAHLSNPETARDIGLLAAVARAYYVEERSRVEIAEVFGISRFKVSRLLSRAREEGVVTIEIHDWGLPDPVLSARLNEVLGLTRCLVVRSHGDDETMRRQIGAAAAAHLSETLADDEVLGVSWGRTLTATTSQLEHLPRLSIVQLTGVVAGDLDSSPIEVARHVARRSGGRVYPIFAPLITPDVETAEGLRSHADIASAMELFPSVTTALLSVGAWDKPRGEGHAVLSQVHDVLSLEDLAGAIADGCVADIAGLLVRADGSLAYPELQRRSINITDEQLRAVPRVLGVAGGAAKATAVRAVAGAGLITELVTDHALAAEIVGDDDA
ncbi:transcriptional regulator [Phycicoccus endophyticus]|uniref:Transcriptional regulator n=1 Tax=Phycicoccus endophyticus TaxID=1690220 RepID=A0A7G9R019_9MICO|nr:sugar-binding domain-containing protein [Phycicoccus endophyticus]NHI20808.1 transcriptional regulator [Phycicoccus endophyticus]QNN48944.1 transcriptional regulator [Phycicoccus endophyticus]GGL44148.1 DeoR family transcriptional regulator [Phycicoccus endophyticus]